MSEPGLPASSERPMEAVCPLCGAPVAPAAERCPACNMTLAGVGGRPEPFTRRSLWRWAAALLAIYLLVLVVVVVVR